MGLRSEWKVLEAISAPKERRGRFIFLSTAADVVVIVSLGDQQEDGCPPFVGQVGRRNKKRGLNSAIHTQYAIKICQKS